MVVGGISEEIDLRSENTDVSASGLVHGVAVAVEEDRAADQELIDAVAEIGVEHHRGPIGRRAGGGEGHREGIVLGVVVDVRSSERMHEVLEHLLVVGHRDQVGGIGQVGEQIVTVAIRSGLANQGVDTRVEQAVQVVVPEQAHPDPLHPSLAAVAHAVLVGVVLSVARRVGRAVARARRRRSP